MKVQMTCSESPAFSWVGSAELSARANVPAMVLVLSQWSFAATFSLVREVAQRTLYDALFGFGHQCGVFQLGAVKYRGGVAYHDGLRADRRAAVQTVGVSPMDGIVADGPVVCHGLA